MKIACLVLVPGRGTAHNKGASHNLHAFARDHFFNDPELAAIHATNRAIEGLYPAAYWVNPTLTLSIEFVSFTSFYMANEM